MTRAVPYPFLACFWGLPRQTVQDAITLSQALAILARFRDNGHIDPDLYELFVNSEIHRRYAEALLAPNQVDC